MICQGAEARVFEGSFCGRPAIIKQRFPKHYRHPELDEKLTRKRLVSEARSLLRCRKAGLRVPCPLYVDEGRSTLYLEKVAGDTVRNHFNSHEVADADKAAVADKIGVAISRLHNLGMVHGDPTTSNLMIDSEGFVVLIDLGLCNVSTSPEDKAVDMYVLERAFISTHPTAKPLLDAIFAAYFRDLVKGEEVRGKLEKVRARGRKRTAFG